MRAIRQTLGFLGVLGACLSFVVLAGDVVCTESDPTCGEGEFCLFPDGTCDDPARDGVCEAIPDGCAQVWDPVCGCDGVTYGNRCEAHVASVSVAYPGSCGRRACSSQEPCDDGDFCKYADDNCFFPFDGLCTPVPESCPDDEAPVCGCDGVTYRNACFADAAGVSIRRAVPCDVVCDGLDELPCDAGEFCLHTMRTGCRPTDSSGECVPLPDDCPGSCQPVCGCDERSYGSVCETVAAEVQPVHFSECDEVRFVLFTSSVRMRWNTMLGVSTYHVYRLVRAEHGALPKHAGTCFASVGPASDTDIEDAPAPGQVWWLQVAAFYEFGEGSLGLASDCSRRAPLGRCAEAAEPTGPKDRTR